MWNKGEGFYAQFKYVELARYYESGKKQMVAREKRGDESVLVEWNKVREYADKHDNTGIYTSIFRYKSSTFRPSDIQLGPLYFDLDSDDLDTAKADTVRLVEYLYQNMPRNAVQIFFTGKKGFHVECEPVAVGISPSTELPGIFRYIAGQLRDLLSISTFDFAVYDARRMWRLPNSKHQSTGLYKVAITHDELAFGDIRALASTPREILVEDQVFDIKSNEWYRGFTYALEASRLQRNVSAQSVIERFQSEGSGHLTDFEREFNPPNLFDNCSAIMELWNKAETKHDLEHEERLFLCSLLTYTDEAVEYLHAILSNCSDYNYEKSQSHIDDWIRRRDMGIGGRPYTCERAASAGIGCSGCSKLEPKPRYEKIGNKLYPTNEVTSPSPIRFAYSRKRD